MSIPEISSSAVSWVSVQEMVEADRMMTGELGVGLLQMMENAGRNLAVLARVLLGGDVAGRQVDVLAGTGGNGGGGLAAARHLLVAGAEVAVTLVRLPRQGSATDAQLTTLRRLGVPLRTGELGHNQEPELVVDAVLGYGQRGRAERDVAGFLRSIDGRHTVALDIPSGLDLVTGKARDPVVRAAATMTLAAPKTGLERYPDYVGALYLADISVPSSVLESVTGRAAASPFGEGPLVHLAH